MKLTEAEALDLVIVALLNKKNSSHISVQERNANRDKAKALLTDVGFYQLQMLLKQVEILKNGHEAMERTISDLRLHWEEKVR